MATIQNTYTGDGSTTNYSFTFETRLIKLDAQPWLYGHHGWGMLYLRLQM